MSDCERYPLTTRHNLGLYVIATRRTPRTSSVAQAAATITSMTPSTCSDGSKRERARSRAGRSRGSVLTRVDAGRAPGRRSTTGSRLRAGGAADSCAGVRAARRAPALGAGLRSSTGAVERGEPLALAPRARSRRRASAAARSASSCSWRSCSAATRRFSSSARRRATRSCASRASRSRAAARS